MSKVWVPTKQQLVPGEDLRGADLRGEDLRGMDLLDADLSGAKLSGANLSGANLWRGMSLNTPSGVGYLIPTPAGWKITIGCWANKTFEDLRAIVEGDDWPESKGVKRERRRPIMAGLLAMCEAHAEYYSKIVPGLAKIWGTE